jgi:organic radical activating enzyme
MSKMTDKFIHSTLTWICNYQCEYCSIGHYNKQKLIDKGIYHHASDKVVDGLIKLLNTKEYNELILSGGEPTLHPRLKELLKVAVENNVKTHITTNFSMPLSFFKELFQIAGELLDIGASLHISQCDVPEFVTKAIEGKKHSKGVFYCSVVLTNEELEIIRNVNTQLKSNGVTFSIKLMLTKDSKPFMHYNDAVKKFTTENNININPSGAHQRKTRGVLCTSGKNSIKIDINGGVYRCLDRWQDKSRLGNIDSFQKFNAYQPCRSDTCNCGIYDHRKAILWSSGS